MWYTDKQRLDFLQSLNDQTRYTGACVLRWSDNNKGWSLHETSRTPNYFSVREAIDSVMDKVKQEEEALELGG